MDAFSIQDLTNPLLSLQQGREPEQTEESYSRREDYKRGGSVWGVDRWKHRRRGWTGSSDPRATRFALSFFISLCPLVSFMFYLLSQEQMSSLPCRTLQTLTQSNWMTARCLCSLGFFLSNSTYNSFFYILCSHQLNSSSPFSSHFLVSSRLPEGKTLFPLW